VTSLYENQPITFTVSSRVTSIAAVGQPLGTFYLYKFLRVNPDNGNAVFATADGGETESPTASDLTFVGNPQPDYFGGLTNTFTWKNFDLRAFLQFSQGNDVFNMTRIFMDDGAYSYDNKSTITLDRWQKPGDAARYKGLATINGTTRTDITRASSRFIQDNNTLYCDAVTLGYLLPGRLTQKWGMSRFQCYVYINNPFVVSSVKQERGIDYPFARNYALSIQLGF